MIPAAAWAVATVLVACGPPKGDPGGRIDPYATTGSDRASSKASIPAMLEFSDRVVASLTQQISAIPEIEGLPTRAVLELGTIENHTRMPTRDFEQLRQRLRGQIFQSSLLRDRFLIVEPRQRMQREHDRLVGAGAEGGPARYDPAITYVLQGDFYESNRIDRRQYYFEFKLTNVESRQIVFLDQFDLAQVTSD